MSAGPQQSVWMLGYVPDIAGYSGPIGTGDDPAVLGKDFWVYYMQFR